MKIEKTFLVGSGVFFNGLKGYSSKDEDYLHVCNPYPKIKCNNLFLHIFPENTKNGKGRDEIFMRKMTKEEYITTSLECKEYLRLGKYIVPEFIDYLGFTINDLKKLAPLFKRLDDKHQYEKIIADAYIKNKSFTLTEEQRLKAYKSYCESRGKEFPY